mmetsp:Transcript_26272/g.54158  ORF Transcript_26272/g.54158 Transcript_26272/m.54158 type:complete len:239 (+) Transcript_26272:1-717(+)
MSSPRSLRKDNIGFYPRGQLFRHNALRTVRTGWQLVVLINLRFQQSLHGIVVQIRHCLLVAAGLLVFGVLLVTRLLGMLLLLASDLRLEHGHVLALLLFDRGFNPLHSVLKNCHARRLIPAYASQHEEWMGYQVNLHLALLRASLETFGQGILDGIDALVFVAGDLNFGSESDRGLDQPSLEVGLDILLDLVRQVCEVHAWLAEVDLGPEVDLLVDVLLVSLEGIVVLLVKWPGSLAA